MYRFKERKMIDINLVLKTVDAMVEKARTANIRLLLALRDYFLFNLLCATGLRVSEVLALNVDSFTQDPDKPELGEYGMMLVQRKRRRVGDSWLMPVPVMDEKIPAMIDQYIREVRPSFLTKSRPDEKALFLSQRGARLSYAAVNSQFRDVLDKAGLGEEGLTMRSVRYSCISRMSLTMPLWDSARHFGNRVDMNQCPIGWFKRKAAGGKRLAGCIINFAD